MRLSAEDIELIRKVLNSHPVQSLIGAEEWDLTEAEEVDLWALIERLNNSGDRL